MLYVTTFIALILVLTVNGALPNLGIPTLGQAVWLSGFSQSFANQSLLSIYAVNFGYPEPAAISFGLAGAYLASLFIRLGYHAGDAYGLMVGLWLTLSFYGGYKIARYFFVECYASVLAATVWCSLPVVVQHSGYSMLSTGIALLPFYLFAALRVFNKNARSIPLGVVHKLKVHIQFLLVTLLSIFMDGYSFMMFACAAVILGLDYLLVASISMKDRLYNFFGMCLSFLVAYVLFALFIGKTGFSAAPLSFFRGWGVDLSFWLQPTRGIHWIADLLGTSVNRSSEQYFGDASVWTTSYILPVLIIALVTMVISKNQKYTFPVICIAAFGLYMSLGPSVKYHSTKPVGYTGGQAMAKEYAVMPTGSKLLSKYLPGFKNMRASYRWGALGILGLWFLIVLGLSKRQPKHVQLFASVGLVVILLLNLPNIPKQAFSSIKNRDNFTRIDEELVGQLKRQLSKSEVVAFLPWSNDFLVNYLASSLDIKAYNIGGDKNLAQARKSWPALMKSFPMARVDDGFAERVALLLLNNEADAVVLTNINMLTAAHYWPPSLEIKKDLVPVLNELHKYEGLDIQESKLYTTVRLNKKYKYDHHLTFIHEKYGCYLRRACILNKGFTPSNSRTKVGEYIDKQLASTNKEGYLLFGPYTSLKSGRYQLVIKGHAQSITGAWVDVVSSKGTKVHKKVYLKNHQDNLSDSEILNTFVELGEDADDVEIRVFVTSEDVISISSYQLME